MRFYYYLVFVFLAFFTPFAFGGSDPWGVLIFNTVCTAFSLYILFKKEHFCYTPVSKHILILFGFIILLALIQLLNQHNFLQKPAFLPFTLCRYYTMEQLSWLFSLTLYYFVLMQTVQKGKDIKNFALILTISAVLISLIGITWQKGEYIGFFTGNYWRSSFGPFTSRNHGSQFVMVSFFISLLLWLPHFILDRKHRLPSKNIWYLTFSIILFLGIFFTHSRGGVIALSSGLFVIVFMGILFSQKGKISKVLYFTLSSAVFCAIIMLIIKYSANIGLRQFGSFSDKARLLLYGAGFNMLKDFPWTGVGFDAFSAAIDAYLPVSLKAFPRYLHNDWLELLLGFGYVYGTIIFSLIFYIVYRVIKMFKALEPKKKLRLSILCGAFTGFAFTALIDFPFHMPSCAFLFCCLLVFISAPSFSAYSNKISIPVIVKILVSFLSLFLLWGNVSYFKVWRSFVFAKKLSPQTRLEYISKSVKSYPSPVFIKRVLLAEYQISADKSLSETERQKAKQEAHKMAAFYLKIYPRDREISQFYLLTK